MIKKLTTNHAFLSTKVFTIINLNLDAKWLTIIIICFLMHCAKHCIKSKLWSFCNFIWMRAIVLYLLWVDLYEESFKILGIWMRKYVCLFIKMMVHVNTNDELMDMVLVYVQKEQNSPKVSLMYTHRFHNRYLPHHETCTVILLRERSSGNLSPKGDRWEIRLVPNVL